MKTFKLINNQSKKECLALASKTRKRFANDLNEICQNKLPFSKFKHGIHTALFYQDNTLTMTVEQVAT